MKRLPVIEIYSTPRALRANPRGILWHWYWRLRASNGRIIADSAESYSSQYHVCRAVERLRRAVPVATVRALS